MQKNFYSTPIFIPAYTTNKEGLLLSLLLKAVPQQGNLQIHARGLLAKAFERILHRTIFILSSLKNTWGCLNYLHFELISENNSFNLKDARSASLPFCISLLNIIQELANKPQISTLVGTGILRLDGSFEESSVEEKKKDATEKFFSSKKQFISPKECNHVFDLEKFFI